jgi:hypothetical protein
MVGSSSTIGTAFTVFGEVNGLDEMVTSISDLDSDVVVLTRHVDRKLVDRFFAACCTVAVFAAPS